MVGPDRDGRYFEQIIHCGKQVGCRSTMSPRKASLTTPTRRTGSSRSPRHPGTVGGYAYNLVEPVAHTGSPPGQNKVASRRTGVSLFADDVRHRSRVALVESRAGSAS